jgi:hypothetical protein
MSHLKETKMGYFKHMAHSLGFAVRLLLISLVGMVHAIIPWMFTKTMSRGVANTHEELKCQS